MWRVLHLWASHEQKCMYVCMYFSTWFFLEPIFFFHTLKIDFSFIFLNVLIQVLKFFSGGLIISSSLGMKFVVFLLNFSWWKVSLCVCNYCAWVHHRNFWMYILREVHICFQIFRVSDTSHLPFLKCNNHKQSICLPDSHFVQLLLWFLLLHMLYYTL